jgi:hypothetical protein
MHLPLEGIKWLEIEESRTKSRPHSIHSIHEESDLEAPIIPIDDEVSSIRSKSTSHSTEPVLPSTKSLQAPLLGKTTNDDAQQARRPLHPIPTVPTENTKPSTTVLKPVTEEEWAKMPIPPRNVSDLRRLRQIREDIESKKITPTKPPLPLKGTYEMLTRHCDYAIGFWELQIRDWKVKKQTLPKYTSLCDDKIRRRENEIAKLSTERESLAQILANIE